MKKTKRGLAAWVGVDFDGTLSYHEAGSKIDETGEPVPAMVAFIQKLLADGVEVRILTARVWVPRDESWSVELANECGRQRLLIMDWCEKYIGKRLQVTCEKDPGMLVLLDDRAVHVIRNTGHFDMPSDLKVD
jgi:hypothetical protein